MSIGRQEVVSFFENNPDSFPVANPLVEISLIQHPVEVGSQTKDSLLVFANTLIDSINQNHLSFEEAAKQYSQDPGSAASGGDLNYTKRGSLLPVYEKMAFSLNIGEVSSPIESVFGIHIIKLVDRVGEKIHTKHILFSLKPSPGDLKNIYKKINSVLSVSFNNPAVFDSVALDYYAQYKNLSGYYVDFDKTKFPLFIQNQISSMEDYSFSPLFVEDGFVFVIYKYLEKKSDSFNLEKDWFIIEQVALNNKRNNLFDLWIEEQKKTLYIKTFSF
jgi:peptidyl-prolyl cis-trans isomerase SurA